MKLAIEPVEGGVNVLYFPVAVIMLALAETCSAKIEAQHGKSKTIQRFHGVKDDLVVQGAAEQRMRVTDQRGVCGILDACVQDCLQAPGRTLQKKRTNR